jgi:2-oxoisovalerate dehydrogenase E1 component
VSQAVARAREGGGPTLIECTTFRMRGHEEASGTAYVPETLFAEWAKRDPLERFEAYLTERGLMDAVEAEALRQRLAEEIRARVDRAVATPAPASSAADELEAVYAPASHSPRPPGVDTREMRYVDAISHGLRQQLEADPRTLLMGQDIAEYGGVFKVTAGFVDVFGRARVRNTPIVESAALGAAMGLALAGYRPMVEMQFADFITCGFNQIVNNLAKTHYRWGAPLPVVIRAPHGGGLGAGPYHSQSVEAWFTHVAGLKVVAPATPADAKGLLLAAFADPNPVLFLEHKLLYRTAKGPVPIDPYTVELGRARVARAGKDATVVTYGVGVRWALDAAKVFADEGVELEVIDLRTLIPWDVDAVIESVRRTSRVLVLHEAPQTGGFGGELAAVIGREAFEWLDAPVDRLGALDTPVPFSKGLETIHSPRRQVQARLRALLRY